MAQHKASMRATLRSAMRHKKSADMMLDSLNALIANIAAARQKVAADTNGSWDTDYSATLAVTPVDFDAPTMGQHKQPARKVIISCLAHKQLGDEIRDLIEESQVTLNLVLAQMDADAGNLAADSVYDAYAIANPLDADAPSIGQHERSMRKTLISAICHKEYGSDLSDQMAAIEDDLNAMIEEIKAKN